MNLKQAGKTTTRTSAAEHPKQACDVQSWMFVLEAVFYILWRRSSNIQGSTKSNLTVGTAVMWHRAYCTTPIFFWLLFLLFDGVAQQMIENLDLLSLLLLFARESNQQPPPLSAMVLCLKADSAVFANEDRAFWEQRSMNSCESLLHSLSHLLIVKSGSYRNMSKEVSSNYSLISTSLFRAWAWLTYRQ